MWIAVAEIARGRRKRSRRSVVLLAALGLQAFDVSAAPPPAPTQLPTGAQVVAGDAAVSQAGAVLDVNQTTQRAIIDWDTFNVGSNAQVNFHQPDQNSATLNRVLDSNPSQILGNISANGQVFLTNPNGVYFGKDAVVDVGGLVATTHEVDADAFMAGSAVLERNGATGSVVNDGSLNAALGGYIALLAPEVRNNGIIVAKLGTVALASGEAFTLNFDGRHLASITAEPSTISALVENRSAVMAPGGVIILSAKAVDALQGGVVRNTGTLEATGFAMKDGRIVLEASHAIENSGAILANAGTDGSPAGTISLTAPEIRNSGLISASASSSPSSMPQFGGQVELNARNIEQTATGMIDVSGMSGGDVHLQAMESIEVSGAIIAAGEAPTLALGGHGGSVVIEAGQDITMRDAHVNVTGSEAGGRVVVDGGTPSPLSPSNRMPTLALLGHSEIRASSRRGRGGSVTLSADRVGLFDAARIDTTGAHGGGDVFVGGGFHGKDASIDNAQQVVIGRDARIDASATHAGNAGAVAVWADGQTTFAGHIAARGGAAAGDGGFVEVSGKENLVFRGLVDASATNGEGGTLLLDPKNITVQTGGGAATTAVDQFSDTPGGDSTIDPGAITTMTNAGTSVVLQANNNITINSAIVSNNTNGAGGSLTFQAGHSIRVYANIDSDDGDITFVANDAAAVALNRDPGNAAFFSNSLIDAGDGTVSISIGTQGDSGSITTGQITAGALTIAHSGPTAGAVSGQIDLGEINIANNLTITAGSARNVINTVGAVIVRNIASINTAGGDVTITGPTTDINILRANAANVTIIDSNAMQIGTTVTTGSYSLTTRGPMASYGTETMSVGGTATFTANNGGFGYADPYIDINNANDFQGTVVLTAASAGPTGTGGWARVRDSNALTFGNVTLARDFTVTSNGTINDVGVIIAPEQTLITAGAGNDIVLDSAANNFYQVRIASGNNVTLVDTNAIEFGDSGGAGHSSISGNLNVTAGGNISQYWGSHYDYSRLTVGGAASFTVTAAASDLLLGPSHAAYNGGYTGAANSISGAVTLSTAGAGTYRDVLLRNTNANAAVVNGLGNGLRDVLFYFDNAASLALPAMSLSGNLIVDVPNGTITQTGALVVDNSGGGAGYSTFRARSDRDLVLNNAGNDFHRITVRGGRDVTLVDVDAIELFGNNYSFTVQRDLSVTSGGHITDGTTNDGWYAISVGGTASLNAGASNITLDNVNNNWNIVGLLANNVLINETNSLVLANSTIAGTLRLDSTNGGSLTQVAASAVTTGSTTTFVDFNSGITLAQPNNMFGALAITNAGAVNIRENDAITQSGAWSNTNAITLTTSNDQAITLDQANLLGNLTITQINNGALSAGAVYIRETADGNGMTQGTAWTVNGTTRLDSGSTSISLTNANNVFGPMQVLSTTANSSQSISITARQTAVDAITDVGGPGAWNTGNAAVNLVAYAANGTTIGGGDVVLANPANVLGDLFVRATNVTITENASITDGASGWITTGNVDLIVANPTAGKQIYFDNLNNQLGALGIRTTGSAGTLGSVLITDNTNLTQSSAWLIGTAPVTLDARSNQIDLSGFDNVLGNILITTTNGVPASVSIRENDTITQGAAWDLNGRAVTLYAANGNGITLTNTANIMGNLTVTGGVVSITENDNITQSGAWTTTGTTTLNPTAGAITLTNANNVLGNLAIGGTPSAVSITENDDITQASAWVQGSTPFTLNAGARDIILSQANNRLGDLTLAAQNVIVTESDPSGISDGNAWVVPGLTTLSAGSANPIVLNANPNSNFGTMRIVSASNADITDLNGIIFDTSTVASGGTLTVTAGGAITQTGAITAPSLRLIGTGYATLTNTGNNVNNLAAGFSGGALNFVNSGNLNVAVVGGTSGITIGANGVTLRSMNGTISGLSLINASSTALDLTTGTTLVLPQLTIAGPQTFTGSTVSGTGITVGGNLTSTASGAITFNSAVTLGADLTIQTTNSAVNFESTLAGATNQLTINAGNGLVSFDGAVSALGATGDATAALQLTSGGATFNSTVAANNGLSASGPVTFMDSVTLANGNAGSLFTGLVTLGRVGGMSLSGYDTMTFNNGVLLQNGPATINSNNSALTFQSAGSVSGPYDLTLNSGTALLTGLNRMGTNLTSLTVTALNPTIPGGGVSIAGAQTYTATDGSSITLNGNVTSTAAGAITFNSPVSIGASSTVTSTNSAIVFGGTVDGANDLTVNSGSGAKTFNGAVGGIAQLGDGTGAALILQGSGATTFNGSVAARSGMTAASNVTFNEDVTLGNGNTGSTFNGLVTTGGADGNTISGFDGFNFLDGLALAGGPISVISNGSTIAFGGAVYGPRALTLNALAGGAGTVTGLQHIGFTSNLTALDITAQTLSLPSTGLAVAGAMSFTAAGGITLNGAVGNNAGPASGQIDFNGPVTLATGAIAVTTNNAAVNFNGTVNGAQALTVNAGSATTTFNGAVGANSALTSVTTDAGSTTAINGGSIRTSGAQTFNDAVTLGADTTLTGVGVTFASTLNGARTLTVNNSGATVFGGIVGGNTALTSITTDAPGTVVVNTTAVTTSGAQTYNENMTLGANVVFTGNGLSFDDIDGARTLTTNAGTGALQVNGAIGGTAPLNSYVATGGTIAVEDVTTSGTQSYTATGGIALGGDLTSTGSAITVTGPATLTSDVVIATSGGDITFAGSASTINGARDLTLTAGTGNVLLGGVVGGNAALTAFDASGNNLTLPVINTVGDQNQSYTALNNITLSQSRTVNAPISFTADSDNSGAGSFILLNGVSLTASNNTLDIRAADLDLQGNSTLSSGSGLMTISSTNARNIALGGSDAAGQLTISGSELSRISSSGGLSLETSGAGWIRVNGITSAQSQNLTGTLDLDAQGTGDVEFIGAASTFNAVRAQSAGGDINVGVNLNTTNDSIQFVTGVNVSGASTISSGGGDISFDSTVNVDNDLIISTSNGVLTFADAVGSNRTLTLNLGGGSVAGLGQLQSTLTGLTVNGSAGITLPAFSINGPQVYNTGPITVTGNLGGVGITFNNVVDVVPSAGTSLTIDARTGNLVFDDLVSFNAVDISLIADEIDFTRAVTGSGSLLLQPYTTNRNVSVGGNGVPIAGLNLTQAELAWVPIGTLSALTIGNASGTGTLDVAGVINAPGTALTLNGGGGITQSGGSITSAALRLYAAGNGISLANAANAFGAVGITGGPSAVHLVNTLDIRQLGPAAWNLGAANVTLDAGTNDIVLNNAGNTFGTLELAGRHASVTEAASTDLGASSLSGNLSIQSAGGIHVSGALGAGGNVSFDAAGIVTQSAAFSIVGNLDVVTTVNAGDVTLNNSAASATTIGNTLVGGNYVLTATGDAVTQASGSSLQVRGDVTVTGNSIVLGGAGNLIGGTTTLPATDTTVLRQSGVITLGNRTESGNLTVISERTNRSFSSALVGGDAIVLDNAANNIGGRISVTASAPTIGTGGDVQTGINQSAGTSISVSGVASFTAEASSQGSLGINLTNDGNSFGTLQLSGNTIDVKNSASGTTTLQGALATTHLRLETDGDIVQTGAITAPVLEVTANGAVTLNHAANDAGSLYVDANGNAISYVDTNGLVIAGINAGGANVSLSAGGNLTQTGALLNVGSLSANGSGAVTLSHASNTIDSIAASSAGSGWQLVDSSGISVAGIVRSSAGDVSLRTSGDLTLNSGGRLQADVGEVVASTEGAGNFINNSGASALVVGSGRRWLVYSNTPDLASGARTIKGGLTSSFRHYGDTYGTYLPGAVTESGNGFIYSVAAPSLVVSAIVNGAASHIYGDNPTGTLGVSISSGLLDSEDNVGNIITGGTATFDRALTNTMNAGSYNILYTGGLTSTYTLVADTNAAAYTVTPATLTYLADVASRVYGDSNPAFSGSISGFKLGEDETILGGSAVWTTSATSTSNAGQYAITGSGYSVGGNYVFAQSASNATALTIERADLIVTVNDDIRTYDGSNYSGGAGISFGAFVNGEDSSVIGGSLVYGGTAQGARNAGNYVLGASGLTALNYDITYVNGALTIERADLVLTANDIVKTYDGTLFASGTAALASGSQLFGSDTLSGGSFAFTNANAGAGNKTVTVSGVNVNDGNGGNNYDITYVSNTTSTINRANLVIGSSNVTKIYDGMLTANGSAIVVGGTLYSNASNGGVQDSLSGGTFAFTDKNVGSGDRVVTTSGVALNDGNGGGNYVVSYENNTTSTINAATLTFNGTIARREYDGTTDAIVSGYTLSGFVGSETLNASVGSASFADKNAGVGKAVTVNGISLSDGANGGLASNYVISTTAAAVGTIDPRVLTLNAVVDDKVYDGTTNATLQSYGLGGFVGTETVIGVYTGSASFADKHVGDDKAITITGINLVNGANGGLASNYVVPTTASSSASITPATLHVAGVVALDKVYDGTNVAYLNSDAATVTGRFGADDVQISSIYGTFHDKNVGTDKAIGAGTVVLSGADAGNYVLQQPTNLTADITPRTLVVSASGLDKVYDGTTSAHVSLTDNRVAGDALTLSSNNAFLDKNAGNGKYVSVSDIQIAGADADNYTVNRTAGTFASITPASLAIQIEGNNRVYDGTRNAHVAISGSPLAGDDIELTYGSALFDDKNAGNGKVVSVSGIAARGADARNYTVASSGNTSANITAAVLTVGAIGVPKSYDGNVNASVVLMDNRFAGDDLSIAASGSSFATPNVGAGKTITVNGLTIAGGADRGNYVLAGDAIQTTGSITGEESTAPSVWPLPPVLPTPLPPTTPTLPPSILDPTLPALPGNPSGGGGGGGSIPGGFSGPGASGGNGGTGGGAPGDTNTGANFGGGTNTGGTALPGGNSGGGTNTGGTPSGGTNTNTGGSNGGGGTNTNAGGSNGGGTNASTGGSNNGGGTNTNTGGSNGGGGPNANTGGSTGGDGANGNTGSGSNTGSTSSGNTNSSSNSNTNSDSSSSSSASGRGESTARAEGTSEAASSETRSDASGESSAQSAGDSNEDSSGTVSGSDEHASHQITVSVVRSPIGDHPGLVSVKVPAKILAASNGFSFALPKALAEESGSDRARVSLADGKPLPSWLRYVRATKQFVATKPPAGALPIEVAIGIGQQQWIMTISEQQD